IAKCMSSRRNGWYLRLIQQIPGNLSSLLLCSCQDRTLLLVHADLNPGHGVLDRVQLLVHLMLRQYLSGNGKAHGHDEGSSCNGGTSACRHGYEACVCADLC